jgi:hypothetical protein
MVVDATGGWEVALDHLDWDLRVLAPIAACGLALIGDPTRYATVGDAVFSQVADAEDRIVFELLGGDAITVVGWSAAPPSGARVRGANDVWQDVGVTWEDEVWRVTVDPEGAPDVEVEVLA